MIAEVQYHGIDHPDYWQGAGVCFTKFDEIVTGIGDTPAEALDDAIEQIAMVSGSDKIDKILGGCDAADLAELRAAVESKPIGEMYHYVSIRWANEVAVS